MRKLSLPSIIPAAIMLLLIIIRDFGSINISGKLIAICATISAFTLPKKDMYNFAYLLLPLAVGIPGYTYLFLSIVLFFRQGKIKIMQILPFCILAFLEIMHVSNYTFSYEIAGVASFLSFLFLFFLLVFSDDTDIDRKTCMLFFCLSTAFAMAIVYARILIDNDLSLLITGGLRSGAGMGNYQDEQLLNHLMMNANSIAYFSITLLSITLVFYSKRYFNRTLLSFLISTSIIFGIFSFSRTWVLVAGGILLFFILGNNNKKTILTLSILFIVFFIIGIETGIFDYVMQVFEYRMENDDVESAGGRIPLFIAYNKVILSNLSYTLFGVGATYYYRVCNLWNSVHNGTQQIFVAFGITGILTYLFAAISFVKKYIHYNVKENFVLIIPFVACLLFVQSIQFLNPYPLMLPIVASACILRINE